MKSLLSLRRRYSTARGLGSVKSDAKTHLDFEDECLKSKNQSTKYLLRFLLNPLLLTVMFRPATHTLMMQGRHKKAYNVVVVKAAFGPLYQT